MNRAALARVVVVALVACGPSSAPPTAEHAAALGGGAAARVGDDVIPAELVGRVAAAQRISPRAAAEELIEDALAAQGARAALGADAPEVRWPTVSARARLVVDRLRAAAIAEGPPTDDEVNELSAMHWREFDLPEQARVIHAVVLLPKKRTPEGDAAAKEVADAIAKAVEGAPDDAAFEQRARAVPHDAKIDVHVERLPAFVADGRIAEGPPNAGAMDATFASAAFTLTKPGAQTRVLTSFGWHTIQLVERLPARIAPFEQRRAAFDEEAKMRRAHDAYQALLTRLKRENPVEISPAANDLTQLVSSPAPRTP